jgi:alkylresorcinol/alkylpyrone synthase
MATRSGIDAAPTAAHPAGALANAPRILAVAVAQPDHALVQSDARAFCRSLFAGAYADIDRLLEVFESARIDERRVSAPAAWLGQGHAFPVRNALYVEEALRLCERAVTEALARAHVAPSDVDHLILVSTTGIATPSLDARLMNRIPFSPHMRRTPIWGLGCAGGAAGLARAAEWASLHPGARVVLVAVEICSLTFQADDLSKSNLVATALFADGAAAVVLGSDGGGRGSDSRGDATALASSAPPTGHADAHRAQSAPAASRAPRVAGAMSTLFPDSEDVMGWEVCAGGLKVLFSRDIPSIVREMVRPNAEEFLAAHGLALSDVRHLVAHPGGTKVMAAYEEAFELPPGALRHARDVLRTCGNMSSPTVLFVLERFLRDADVRAGDWGLLTALGPGFSSELVLLQW